MEFDSKFVFMLKAYIRKRNRNANNHTFVWQITQHSAFSISIPIPIHTISLTLKYAYGTECCYVGSYKPYKLWTLFQLMEQPTQCEFTRTIACVIHWELGWRVKEYEKLRTIKNHSNMMQKTYKTQIKYKTFSFIIHFPNWDNETCLGITKSKQLHSI